MGLWLAYIVNGVRKNCKIVKNFKVIVLGVKTWKENHRKKNESYPNGSWVSPLSRLTFSFHTLPPFHRYQITNRKNKFRTFKVSFQIESRVKIHNPQGY